MKKLFITVEGGLLGGVFAENSMEDLQVYVLDLDHEGRDFVSIDEVVFAWGEQIKFLLNLGEGVDDSFIKQLVEILVQNKRVYSYRDEENDETLVLEDEVMYAFLEDSFEVKEIY